MQRAGTSKSEQSKQSRREKMIRKAKVFRIVSAEMRSTANPRMTENALIVIPLPVVLRVFFMASVIVMGCLSSVFNLQKRWMV